LNDQKKEAKKNRPLMINCRKFIRFGGKNFNSPPVRKSTYGRLKQEIFASRQYSEFLFGNLSQAGFLKHENCFDFETNLKFLF